MTKAKAIEILTEMNKWRRVEAQYKDVDSMPFKANEYGEALDFAVSFMIGSESEVQDG